MDAFIYGKDNGVKNSKVNKAKLRYHMMAWT